MLGGVVGVDRAAILRADIVALPVQRGGIVHGEEHAQQVFVGDDVRIERHLHHLGMPGVAGADLLVGRVRDLPAGESRGHARHPAQFQEHRLQAPEAAAAQCCQFARHAPLLRWRRDGAGRREIQRRADAVSDPRRPVAVVLAGGLARRMGGGDKGLLRLARRPLLDHVLDRIRPQVRAVALSANGDPARFIAWGLPVLRDPVLNEAAGPPGPLGGVLAGMRWARQAHPRGDAVAVGAHRHAVPAPRPGRAAACRARCRPACRSPAPPRPGSAIR